MGIEPAYMHTDIYDAYLQATEWRNDVIYVAPDSHVWTGTDGTIGGNIAWAKDCTHLIGMCPGTRGGGNRARFGHSTGTAANMLTVSGHNNLFKNLYWMHGSSVGGASDVTCMTVSGSRNVFDCCHIASPMDPTQGADADLAPLVVSGSQNYFKDCQIGVTNAVRHGSGNTASVKLEITGGSSNVFENCIFLMGAASASPFFVDVTYAGAAASQVLAYFLNCQFVNCGRADLYSLTYGVNMTPALAKENILYFDNRCSFVGVDDVVAATREDTVWWGGSGANADVTAIGDDIGLGLAMHPNVS
jgi:hypothetical protein